MSIGSLAGSDSAIPTFFELSLARWTGIVCMSSNQHQVPFCRCIRFCKQGLLITLQRGAYCGLYCQKTGSIRGPIRAKKVDCDSAHAATTLALPVVAFEMLGSM